jgi:hypothetical protein
MAALNLFSGQITWWGVATPPGTTLIGAHIISVGTMVRHRPKAVEKSSVGREGILESASAIFGIEHHRLGSQARTNILG